MSMSTEEALSVVTHAMYAGNSGVEALASLGYAIHPIAIDEGAVEKAAKVSWEVNHPNPPGWSPWESRDIGPSSIERRWELSKARAAISTYLEAVRSK